MEPPGAGGINSSECENVSREKETSEEFEANAMDSLRDMPFATIDIRDDCGITDVPHKNLERSKENERISKDQIKKRKKKQKDYQPNYFLSIPIINKEDHLHIREFEESWRSEVVLLTREVRSQVLRTENVKLAK